MRLNLSCTVLVNCSEVCGSSSYMDKNYFVVVVQMNASNNLVGKQ